MNFLAVLGFHCCMQGFSSCGERGLLLVGVCGLFIMVAPLVEHRLQGAQALAVGAHGLRSCSPWALDWGLNICGARVAVLWHVGSSWTRD